MPHGRVASRRLSRWSFVALLALASCVGHGGAERGAVSRPIDDVLAAHSAAWMAIPGVTGTGQGEKDGRPAIVIYVVRATPELLGRLPKTVEGYAVEVRETGVIRALGDSS